MLCSNSNYSFNTIWLYAAQIKIINQYKITMKNFKTLIVLAACVAVFVSCKKYHQLEEVVQPSIKTLNTKFADVRMCTEMYLLGTTPRGATIKTSQWTPGSKIKVSLNGGTSYIRNKVIQFASEWEKYANIDFQFVTNDNSAQIRVSFTQNIGSWSYLGKDALSISSANPTMNFGWFTDSTSDNEFYRTTVHEFGHALGMIHEHQQPLVSIPWDKPKVYEYYASTQGWDKQQVDNNLFSRVPAVQTNFSVYDSASIMHYPVEESLTIGNYSIGWNTSLSPTDKTFIASVYPK